VVGEIGHAEKRTWAGDDMSHTTPCSAHKSNAGRPEGANRNGPLVDRDRIILEPPPSDPEAEIALIAAEVHRSGSLDYVGAVRSDFYTPKSLALYDAIDAMREAQAPINVATLTYFLMHTSEDGTTLWEQVGGEGTIHEIENLLAAAEHPQFYLDRMRDSTVRRNVKVRALALADAAGKQSVELTTLFEQADFSSLEPIHQDRFAWLTAAELDAGDFEQRYLIPGILAEGQPGGIYAPFKTLKTSFAVDLCLSCATAFPFLGHFPIAAPVPTAIMSGESGMSALQSIARRVCRARGCSLDQVADFHITAVLPRLGDPADMRRIGRFIVAKRLKLLCIDPAYLCMDCGDDAGNLFLMGRFLKPIAELCASTGCTIKVLHHNNRKNADSFRPAELSHVAWSGFAEFSAQWILISRRSRFDKENGNSEVWLNVGGRAGHCGLYCVDVHEGRHENAGGRVWEVTAVHTASETRAAAAEAQVDQRKTKREQKLAKETPKHREAVLKALRAFPDGETAKILRDTARLSGTKFSPIIADLVSDGTVEPCKIPKGFGRLFDAYRLRTGTSGTSGTVPIVCPAVPLQRCMSGTGPPLEGAVRPVHSSAAQAANMFSPANGKPSGN
jgi:hypothetical protein